jgi:hypothetical protein
MCQTASTLHKVAYAARCCSYCRPLTSYQRCTQSGVYADTVMPLWRIEVFSPRCRDVELEATTRRSWIKLYKSIFTALLKLWPGADRSVLGASAGSPKILRPDFHTDGFKTPTPKNCQTHRKMYNLICIVFEVLNMKFNRLHAKYKIMHWSRSGPNHRKHTAIKKVLWRLVECSKR